MRFQKYVLYQACNSFYVMLATARKMFLKVALTILLWGWFVMFVSHATNLSGKGAMLGLQLAVRAG